MNPERIPIYFFGRAPEISRGLSALLSASEAAPFVLVDARTNQSRRESAAQAVVLGIEGDFPDSPSEEWEQQLRQLASVYSGVPLLCISRSYNPAAETAALAIGASHYWALDELTPALLRRSLMFALRGARQHSATAEGQPEASLPGGPPDASADGPVPAGQASHPGTPKKGGQEAVPGRDQFFGISLDLLCTADEEGHFHSVNPSFTEILGYTAGQLVASSFWDLVHPEDLSKARKAWEQATTGVAPVHFSIRYRSSNGAYKWLSWTVSLHQGVAYAVARDISEIKEAEFRLERSLALLQATLEATADGILVLDENGQIADFNKKFLTMWGLTPEQVANYSSLLVLEHMQGQITRPASLQIPHVPDQTSGPARGYDLLTFHDGRVLERYTQPQVLGDRVLGRVWSFRDISERKWAESVQRRLTAQLESERQRLKDTLANLPGIVWESWLPGTEHDEGRTPYVSDYVKKMLGYEVEEWLQSSGFWLTLIHPEDLASTFATQVTSVRDKNAGAVYRYRMRAKDGHYVWVETHTAVIRDPQSGEVLGMRAVSMDISDRMHAQDIHARMVALLEATTDFVGWADPEGTLQYINRAGREMLGMGQDEAVGGLNIADLAPRVAGQLVAPVQGEAQDGLVVWSGESYLIARGGEKIPVSQVVVTHRSPDGSTQFVSTIARDITERLRIEEQLRQAKDELEQRVVERTAALERANQDLLVAKEEADAANNAKSEFLSRMSHELRTPLNAILGFGQILEMRSVEERDREAVEQILVAGRHLLDLINEVLDISRIESGHLPLTPENVPVLPMLRAAMDLLGPLAQKRNVVMESDFGHRANTIETPLLSLHVDRQRFHQIVLNLLSNSIKYNRPGGRVVVKCREKQQPAARGVTPALRIEIIDTGPGLTAEELQRLFRPFERLGAQNSGVEGTGIGLVLARRLTEAMGGKLGVTSVPGQGSVFWLEFPLPPRTVTNRDQKSGSNQPADAIPSLGRAFPRSTILYIEDNPSNLDLVARLFSEVPQVQLLTAGHGQQGLRLALEYRPDLVLLDLHLPDMLGEDVLRHLSAQEQTRQIPVVAVSADSTERQIDRVLAAGARQYLTKPLNISEFMETLQAILSQGDAHAGTTLS